MKTKEFTLPKELLPDWGPYSKKYIGISKVTPATAIPGARFDCVVHPMLANTNQPAPNVTFPASWHIWEAAPDLSYFAYRVELEVNSGGKLPAGVEALNILIRQDRG